MKQVLAAISMAVIVNCGAAYAQNTPTPKPEDAERNAFETPSTGKDAAASHENGKDRKPDANPESRMNDAPPPQERPGASKAAPK
jgi:hypothetical protein